MLSYFFVKTIMPITPIKPNTQNHVIIIGGGHVGLSFALLLAHRGIYSTLIETVSYPAIAPDQDTKRQHYLDSRNTALSRRSVQIYQEIKLWQHLENHACRIDGVLISELGSFGRATLDKNAEGVESFGFVMENAWLGRQLLQAVRASEFITLLDGTQVTDIAQDNTSVTVRACKVGQQATDNCNVSLIEAPLAVACDGQNSPIRQLLGVKTKVHDYCQVGIVGVVQTDKPHQHLAIEKFSSAGPLALLPLLDEMVDDHQSHRRSVVFICPKGEEQRYLQDDEHFLATLQSVFGDDAGTFIKAGRRGAYPLSKVLATRQVVGRCVLMGNAAHTLHPVAGQGFNLCLRDAHALANMLGDVLKTHSEQGRMGRFDFGDQSRLLAYEVARQKDQKRVVHFCDTVVGSFTNPNPLMKFARNVGLIAFDKIPGIKPLVASYAMGLKS